MKCYNFEMIKAFNRSKRVFKRYLILEKKFFLKLLQTISYAHTYLYYVFKFFSRNSNSSLKDDVLPAKDETDSKVSRQLN